MTLAAPARWCVVGGGALGITLALELAGDGHEVTLLEGAADLGGLASAWTIEVDGGPPVVWDRHYHVTLSTDAATRRFLARLGLEEHLRWVETKTGFTAGDRVVSVSNAAEFLRLPSLSLLGKARLAATILVGSAIRDGERMERILVDDWLRRWSGRATFERFWLPLLRAKLGDNHRITSASFIWATIQRLWRARRTGMKVEQFGYVPGGYAAVLARAGEVLAGAGVDVRTATRVKAVRAADGDGLDVDTESGSLHFDRVVVTAAAPIAASLCPDLDPSERRRLEGVTYQGIVCASLVLDRPLSPYYLTYLTDPACPFTGIVEMTALVDPAQVGGHTLVYLPKYVASDDPFLAASDDEVRAAFLPYLQEVHPDLRDDEIRAFRVSRVRHVMAVPTLRYSDHVPPVRTSVDGLYLVSSANIVNATLNVDDTVALAETTAKAIRAWEAVA